ncbi:MAG TPA: DUF4279 domain-containing protein [Candidatus Acidoferrum sp.]|jgi:hypothetical protein
MPTYTISQRIESQDLDVAQVTNELGIQPTQSRRKGDRRSENSVWEKALWEIEIFSDGDRSEWESLEAGLEELVRLLTPHLPTLKKYKKSCEIYLWCGVFDPSFGGGPRLSAETLSKLSALGAPVLFAIYPEMSKSEEEADSSLRSE